MQALSLSKHNRRFSMLNAVKKILWVMLFWLCAAPMLRMTGGGEVYAQVDTAWVRRYNGPGNGNDNATGMVLDTLGNIYITGSSVGSGTSYDATTIKYDLAGNTVWLSRYDGYGSRNDYSHFIAMDGSGNVYVSGESDGLDSAGDILTIKYYPNGDSAWTRTYNGPGNQFDAARGIVVDDSAGYVYVTGVSCQTGTWPHNFDYCTIKYKTNGDTVWVRRYNGIGNDQDQPYAMGIDRSGNVYVTGYSFNSGSTYGYLTIKYYPNGDTAWIRGYNPPASSSSQATALAIDTAGNVYVAGQTSLYGNLDLALVKYYPNGDTAWTRIYHDPANAVLYPEAIAVDLLGNVYLAMDRGFTIKYFPNGDTAWVRQYDALFSSIAVDGSGSVYVTGQGQTWLPDYVTIKYYHDGGLAWVRTYDGPDYHEDWPQAIALDHSGNVYVTGFSTGIGSAWDIATIKYAQYYLTDTLRVLAFSPVDLIVTDPQGDSIGIGFNTIPGATYDTTQDYNMDGDKDDIVTIPNRLLGTYLIRVVPEPGGSGTYDLGIRIDGGSMAMLALNNPCPGSGEVDTFYYNSLQFESGDANGDWVVDVGDAVYLINYLYKSSSAPSPLQAGDANCDGNIDVGDVVYLINYLFKGGSAPSC
jgi:hypothetical protein